MAATLEELQTHVDAFDVIYNTERPHQGLPGRVTPQTAWEATEKAEAPRPKPEQPFFAETVAKRRHVPVPTDLPDGTSVRKLTSAGALPLGGVTYMIGGTYGFQQVLVITDNNNITIADLEGEILIEHTRPAPGVTYVGNGKPRGPRPNKPQPSPKS